jgi:hypothetical protein
MRGYTVVFYFEEQQVTLDDLLEIVKMGDVDVDAVIIKIKTGWTSPKQHLTLSLRKEEQQIMNVASKNELSVLTIDSFKKGNVSKLLFNGKNFSPSIIKRIEKLLRPPEGSNAKIRQIIIQTDEGKWVLNPRFIPNKKVRNKVNNIY